MYRSEHAARKAVVVIMAWISVHEDIIGGKLRELSKSLGCSQNESIGILIRLWLWCINNAEIGRAHV